MGAHLNAYTSREQTVYYAKAFSKDLPRGNCFHSSEKQQRMKCLSSFRCDNTEWCFCNITMPAFLGEKSFLELHRNVWKGECQEVDIWNILSLDSQKKIPFGLLPSCRASLMSPCKSWAIWSLGWVLLLEPDFSGCLKIHFPFPSLFSISCGNSCWHNSEQYPGRSRDWARARSYTSRDARGWNQFTRSRLWLPSCYSLSEDSPGTDNFGTHRKHQVCPNLWPSLIVW